MYSLNFVEIFSIYYNYIFNVVKKYIIVRYVVVTVICLVTPLYELTSISTKYWQTLM